ncbi:family 10 glycosylhydrolase [Synechocystis sp. FACHB-383]|uniref:family 10 glycosylhydrolase n=1 Tax=Synechocystis sp. FACHB-383 TaxID=2692864 RepID=UPI00168A29C4|nr:family 10 glycosylhydrolase [Synechocystis sp. FACHB-383]MBD2654725.1 family 10 glycosylhydrolase [Synechocystis sp. FACHB-383]
MAIASIFQGILPYYRKPFWRHLLLGLLVSLAIVHPFPLFGQLQAQNAFPEIRGVWITNNDTVRFLDENRTTESINLLADLNFNTIYPVVWNSGYVLYESEFAKREGLQPFSPRGDQGQDVLADIIAKAHRRNMLVLPWFEFGFKAPPMSELVKRHPWWFTQKRDGTKTSVSAAGEVMWMNPFHPQVQAFITQLVMDAVNKYDLDGVQFDDHTALPNEFGYDNYTISLYQQETKKTPPSNPKDPAWIRWRADKITAFMVQLNARIKAAKPNILVSVSPATYNLAYNTFLQDWLDWIRKGIVDEVIVQVYRTSLPTFTEPIQRAEFREAKTRIPTAVGILTGLPTKQVPMPLVNDKVYAARAQGMGASFFYYQTLWDVAPEEKDYRIQSFRRLFASPAPRSLARIAPPPPATPVPSVPPSNPPPTSQGTPAPPLQGIPIPVQMPGAPAPANNPVAPNPPPPTPASQEPGGFAPEPVLDDSIPVDWY